MARFPHRKQMDSRDCGAACLQMIARHYGKSYRLQTLREYSFISREGASMMGVSDAAERIGFNTAGLCTGIEKLIKEVTLPCILHWNQEHYVVCYKIKRKKRNPIFYIADPASTTLEYSEQEFKEHWLSTKRHGEERGLLLMLEPGTDFYHLEDEKNQPGKERTLRHYLRYLAPYKWQLAQTFLSMTLFMLLGLIFPFLTQSMVDVGIRGGNAEFVLLILIAQCILTFTNLSIGFLQSWISMHVNTRINIALVSDFWSKLMKLPVRFFDTKLTGDLMQRIGDHGRIENFLVRDSINILFSTINLLIYASLLAYYDFTILCTFLFGHLLYTGWVLCFLNYRKQLDYKAFGLHAKNYNTTLQMLQGMQEIKFNNEERYKRWEWEEIQAKLFKNGIRGLKINQIQGFGATILTQTTGLVISYMVARKVIDGEMTFGMMMALSYIIGQVGGPISRLIGFIHSFQFAKISLERLNEIHGREDEEAHADELRTELPMDGSLHFKHVNFSYNGSPRSLVLKDISFDIPQHSITAIVGMSGSGKTTIMKLLQGFYDPLEGDIKIGTVPPNKINPHLWRSKVGAVMQDGYLFSDTIARNIATGVDEIDQERLYQAAKTANILDFIDGLPLGFNTRIGMEGTGVSQGQRQRILIARAVYKNPEYLLFDEATNALDSQNEKIIMENLKTFYEGKTVVIAAHRLSTIRHADRIIVMKEGKIIESGTHEELMEKQGDYYKLVENQMEKLNK